MLESLAVTEICICLTPGKVHHVCFILLLGMCSEKRRRLRQRSLATLKGMSDAPGNLGAESIKHETGRHLHAVDIDNFLYY